MTLTITDLAKRYPGELDQKAAVRGISLDVRPGEIFTLLGPSGCGKTTTLRTVAGLETPDRGRIEIDGRCVFSSAEATMVPAHHRPLAMVFQSYAVWPHLSVLKNVAYPLRSARMPKAQAHRRATEALEMVGLGEVADRMPGALSGGQQQRVALARAVVRSEKLLLLDEPLSNLDAKLRVQMRAEIRELQRSLGVTVLYVTHDQEEAITLSDRIAVMRSGSIVEVGRPAQLYATPADLFTAQFMGESNLVPVQVHRGGGDTVIVDAGFARVGTKHFSPGPEGSTHHYLFLRPEAVGIVADDGDTCRDNEFRGKVVGVTYLGKLSQYQVDVGARELTVQAMSEQPFTVGQSVRLRVDAERSVVFGATESLAR